MKRLLAVCLFVPTLAFAQAGASPTASNPSLGQLKPLHGPGQGAIASKASLKVGKGHLFFNEADSKRFLQLAGNPPQDGQFVFAPESLDWFAVFSFSPIGYVKDNEKIDAAKLLQQMKDSDEASNEQRKRLGLEALYTVGWKVPPHYDPQTNRLEWGLKIRTGAGNELINYTSRILGREGVMKVVLVADDKTFDADTQAFKAALTGFKYNPGASYAEFRSGDKVAQYGLTALVVGAGAAAASKKGLWKLLAGGGALLLAGLARLFRRS